MTKVSDAWCWKRTVLGAIGEHASTMDRRYERKGNEAEKQGFLKKGISIRPSGFSVGWGGQREKKWCQKYEEALTNTETNTESSDVIY